mmetsp:Transcript_113055/g.314659  ORF Transcript_113055/g.314659 Transcript_113055/m.314659 type:complete len:265 (+) Transcript_113055:279-1073(+)
MVEVRRLSRLVLQTAPLVLASQEHVHLKWRGCKPDVRGWKRYLFTLLAERFMEERKDRPLPKGVTRVNELVSSSLEPALHAHLPVGRPVQERMQVKSMSLLDDAESSKTAICISAMGFQTRLACNAPLICLTPAYVLGDPFDKLIGQYVQHGRHCNGTIGPAHVCFAFVVHHEATLRGLHSHQELVGPLTVHSSVSWLPPGDDECSSCSVSGRKVRQLPRPATEAAIWVLAVRDEGCNPRSPAVLVEVIQDLKGMRDPEDEPGS